MEFRRVVCRYRRVMRAAEGALREDREVVMQAVTQDGYAL
eukprot:COSAG02_NODE_63575_length_263_cov_0.524390_1_plen_39_part_01